MQSKVVCEEFERKMWLFMDKSLEKEEMLFWERHARECTFCSSRLMETKETLSLYESIPIEDIEDETFDLLINKAVKKSMFSRISSKLLDPLYGFSSDGFIKKFALGSAAFAMVLVILFLMYKPGDLPELKKSLAPKTETSPLVTQNAVTEKAPSEPMSKSEVTPVKYEWKDRRTAIRIRHVGASLARIRVKKENYGMLDEWALQAMALKRKMEFLRADLDKSAM